MGFLKDLFGGGGGGKDRVSGLSKMRTDPLSGGQRKQLESERQAVLGRLKKVGAGGGALGEENKTQFRKDAVRQFTGQGRATINRRSKTRGFQTRQLKRRAGGVGADLARGLSSADVGFQRQFDLENLALANQFIGTSAGIEGQRKQLANKQLAAISQEVQAMAKQRSKSFSAIGGAAGAIAGSFFGPAGAVVGAQVGSGVGSAAGGS